METQNISELMIARIDALIAELNQTKANLNALAELIGIDLTTEPSGDK